VWLLQNQKSKHAEADPAASEIKPKDILELEHSSLDISEKLMWEEAGDTAKETGEPRIPSSTPEAEHDDTAENSSSLVDGQETAEDRGAATIPTDLENSDVLSEEIPAGKERPESSSIESPKLEEIESESDTVRPTVAEEIADPEPDSETPELASHDTLEAADTSVRSRGTGDYRYDEPSILDLNAPPPELGSTHMEASDPAETHESASIQDEGKPELIPEGCVT
jgi:hypothetical protein